MAEWHCAECDYDNEEGAAECESCGAAKPASSGAASGAASDDKFHGYVVGVVEELEALEGKDKLKKLTVNVGKGANLTVVTNAPNVVKGCRLVIATVGSVVRTAKDEVTVKKTSVGGVPSEGIVCDAPMLGWTGGGAGTAALLPDTFEAGARPPESRPRMK